MAARGTLTARVALSCILGLFGCRSRPPPDDAETDSGVKPDGGAADAGTFDAGPTGDWHSCNATTGLGGPLPECSDEEPCAAPLGAITSPIDLPACNGGSYDDAPPFHWIDNAEFPPQDRYACQAWSTATPAEPLPLVVFFHGAHGKADDLYDYTSLRAKAETASLSTVPGRNGFVIASMQGRNLQWNNGNPAGRHFDFYYRDLASSSTSPEVRAADHLIDSMVATGRVDPTQIYLVAWSNGGFFAQQYAIARFVTPTPGGNRVAAGSVYAGADPFANLTDAQSPSCALNPYPKSAVPIQIVHRDCDEVVPCDNYQRIAFGQPPGYDVRGWLALLTGVRRSQRLQRV